MHIQWHSVDNVFFLLHVFTSRVVSSKAVQSAYKDPFPECRI